MTQLEFWLSTIDFQQIVGAQDWTFKVSAGASYVTPNLVETLGVDTTGSNFIVLITTGQIRNIIISDRINGVLTSNSWTLVSDIQSGGRLFVYYCLNPQVGNNHTFRATDSLGGGYFGSLHILSFDGATTSPLGYQATEIRPFFGGSRYQTASVAGATPSINKSLFVLTQAGGVNTGLTQGSNTISSDWTPALYNKNGQNIVLWSWYQIQATASSVNTTFSYGTWSGYILTALNNYIR